MNIKQLQEKSLNELTAMYWAYNDAYHITGNKLLITEMEKVDKVISIILNEMEVKYEYSNFKQK